MAPPTEAPVAAAPGIRPDQVEQRLREIPPPAEEAPLPVEEACG